MDDHATLTGAMVQHLLHEHGFKPVVVELCDGTGYGGAPRPTSIVLRFRSETEADMFAHMLRGGGALGGRAISSRRTMTATVTRHVGWCPVCDRDIKVREHQGVMALVHHGYNRPGHGYIVGDCFGVHYPPHELSPECAAGWQARVQLGRAKLLGEIAALPRVTQLPRSPLSEHMVKKPAGKDDPDWYLWQDAYEAMERHLKRQLDAADEEIARMQQLVDTWEPQPLRDFAELEGQAQRERAERDTVVKATRSERLNKAIASYRKRIDAAVRNENAATLAEIWESAQRKLPDLARPLRMDMSRESALALLDRDRVWGAFGLIDERGYRLDVTNWRTMEKLEDRGEARIISEMMNTRYKFHAPMPWPKELS